CEADLYRFGPQGTRDDPPCGLRTAPRSHVGGSQAGEDADRRARRRRDRAVSACYESRHRREHCGGGELPAENNADRLAQGAKHGVLSLRTPQSLKIISHAPPASEASSAAG